MHDAYRSLKSDKCLRLSDQRAPEANEQLDKLFVTDNSSEDSFTAHSPVTEDCKRRRNTLQGTATLEKDSIDSRRLKEVMTLFSELALVKNQKMKLEEELRAVKTAYSGEIARAETEQKATSTLHAREIEELRSKLVLVESDLAASVQSLQVEKSELLAKLQFAELRLGQVTEDLKAGKKERDALSAEIRTVRKDKEDLAARYMKSREQEMALITRLSESQLLHQASESERLRLTHQLSEGTLSPRSQTENECSKLRSQTLALERKVLALEADLAEAQRAAKSRDEELKKARQAAEQMRQFQHEATKWRHLSVQKDSDISYLTRAKDELTKALADERKLLFEVMQEMDTRMSDMSGSRTSKHYHS